MIESGKVTYESLLVPTGIALRTEEIFALVVIDAMHDEAIFMEKFGDLRSD